MKLMDNRSGNSAFNRLGNAIHVIKYKHIPETDDWDQEYGFYTEMGYVIACTIGELQTMLQMINDLKEK